MAIQEVVHCKTQSEDRGRPAVIQPWKPRRKPGHPDHKPAQGGKATIDSYPEGVPTGHLLFLSEAVLHHLHGKKLFVHAGIDPLVPLEKQDQHTLLWDRTLAALALDAYPHSAQRKPFPFDEIYIGHTPISFPMPIKSLGVWLMDTGAGWSGVLSMMNVETKEMFISDPVPELYPGVEGRTRRNRKL